MTIHHRLQASEAFRNSSFCVLSDGTTISWAVEWTLIREESRRFEVQLHSKRWFTQILNWGLLEEQCRYRSVWKRLVNVWCGPRWFHTSLSPVFNWSVDEDVNVGVQPNATLTPQQLAENSARKLGLLSNSCHFYPKHSNNNNKLTVV